MIRSVPFRSAYARVEATFLRCLGLVYLIAFLSLGLQILPLFGSHGIVPVASFLQEARATFGPAAYRSIPTLLWLGASDAVLLLVCVLGVCGSVLLLLRRAVRISAVVCWALYLSVVSAGSPFMNFQWDALLLEAGFLAIFAGAPLLVWAYRLLLFRLLFESGLVKLTSGDPTWRSLHALSFHFFTQPLPTPLAWHLQQLPEAVLELMTACTFGLELAVPFLLLATRRLRMAGVALSAILQIAIALSGNYGFFNLLTLILLLWCLDDQVLVRFGFLATPMAAEHRSHTSSFNRFSKAALSAPVAALLILQVQQLADTAIPGWPSWRSSTLASLEIVNSYGLFAVMTTRRTELVLEGSDNNTDWRAYEFRFKPGAPRRELPWVQPYMPRLDWQMWFAALGSYTENRWVGGLMYRLMVGDRSVTWLMRQPLPFSRPPRYMRVRMYSYTFTDRDERTHTGAIWNRQDRGIWYGPGSLTGR